MDWQEVLWALVLGAMLVVLFPRARQMLKESPEGSGSDWMAALIPLALVGAFIVLLVMLV